MPDDPDAAAVGLRSLYGGMAGAYGSADPAAARRPPPGQDWRMCNRPVQHDEHVPHTWEHQGFRVTCPGRLWGERERGCGDRR